MKIGSVFGFLKHLIDICIFPNKLIELDGLGTINWFLVPDDQFLYALLGISCLLLFILYACFSEFNRHLNLFIVVFLSSMCFH